MCGGFGLEFLCRLRSTALHWRLFCGPVAYVRHIRAYWLPGRLVDMVRMRGLVPLCTGKMHSRALGAFSAAVGSRESRLGRGHAYSRC